MSGFRIGEIVDLAIKGAHVVGEGYDERYQSAYISVALAVGGGTATGRIHLEVQGLTVERVAPAEWPPRIGDLWRDRDGDLWFGYAGFDMDNVRYVDLRSATGKGTQGWGPDIAFYANDEHGPMTLVHREEQDEAAPAETAESESAQPHGDVELLRRAAAKLRDRDRAAFVEMTTCPGGYATTSYADYLLAVLGETEPRTPVLEFAVMMSPPVASTLADWLESVADEADKHAAAHPSNCATEITDGHPIEIARAVLGEQDGGEK